MTDWKKSACILCENNCGIEVQLDDAQKHIVRTRGDKAHPASQGYLCQKASRLDYYQNGKDRILSPLKKRADGSFEEISWEQAIAEVAERFTRLKDDFGGKSIFYYGGGGQGNHLPGAYSSATRKALGSSYRSNALAQEKTGEFWVNGQMLGTMVRGDFEHCEVAVFIGKNPWQSHGIPRSRITLKDIQKDPSRKMVVIDPVRTETADMADYHLQLKPGTDAWLLNAMIAIMFEESLIDTAFVVRHCDEFDAVKAMVEHVNIAEHCLIAGLDEALVRATTRCIANAGSAAFFEDLGVQMNRHSTVVSYLEKLVWILSGNFGKEGAQYIPAYLQNIAGSGKSNRQSPVVGANIISGLVPCNVIADEILTDHPNRYRGMLVESANPAHSLAESGRFKAALQSLDTLVVIDIAMSETAVLADYILPAKTQYEKYEATFFNFEFPKNYFHLRHPLFEAPNGPLSEAEIHARLVEALNVLPENLIPDLREAKAKAPAELKAAFMTSMQSNPKLAALAPVVLYRVLANGGDATDNNTGEGSVLWPLAQMFAMRDAESLAGAGFEGKNAGDELYAAMLSEKSGFVFAIDDYAKSWKRLQSNNGRIQLATPQLLALWQNMLNSSVKENSEFPLVLCAGERRAYTANTINRDPAWRRKDVEGALRVSTHDAERLGLKTNDKARLTTAGGSVETTIEVSERMQTGHLSLPNGAGLDNNLREGKVERVGIAANQLTLASNRDDFAGTPLHKFVEARLEAI